MIVCLSYKRKPWIVRYREPWSGKRRQAEKSPASD